MVIEELEVVERGFLGARVLNMVEKGWDKRVRAFNSQG